MDIQQLLNRIPISKTESGWGYDGPFSTYKEWHAFTIGLYHGLKKLGKPNSNSDVEAEPHYYKGGYVIGYLLKVAILLAVGGSAAL